MSSPVVLDVRLRGLPKTFVSYLVTTDDGPALVDPGPSSSLGRLRAELDRVGVALSDIRHLLLTHIHLDHAGAAGALVREHPSLQVHVSPVGAPHVIDPAKLESSARRLYGDLFDELWGELAPVPTENVHETGSDVLGLTCFASPGHASHHVTYVDRASTLYGGDVTGVRLMPSRFVFGPTAPPDIDLEAWESSLEEVERREPRQIALAHAGLVSDVSDHVARLRTTLRAWGDRVGHGMDKETFIAAAVADIAASDPEDVGYYRTSAPLDHCFLGLERYWRKRREAAQT